MSSLNICDVMKTKHRIDDVFLLILISLSLSSKLFETKYFNTNEIHSFSQHKYNNSQILKMEILILESFKFEFFTLDRLTGLNKLTQCVYLVHSLIPRDKFEFFAKTAEVVFEMVVIKRYKIKHEFPIILLIISIIQVALIILTQTVGQFPAVWKLQNLFLIDESQIFSLSRKILKIVLGKEIFNQLDF